MPGIALRPGALAVVARTVPPAVAALSLLAAAPSFVIAATGRHSFTGALSAASLIAGAGVGYAADDPAAPTLASSPTTLAARRLLRAAVVVLVLGGGWLAALLVASRYGRLGPGTTFVLAELCAAAALSAAVAARARTEATVASGFGAVVVSLLAMIIITSLSYQWPALPSVARDPGHARWWWVTAAGFALAAWASRDPARRAPAALRRRTVTPPPQPRS